MATVQQGPDSVSLTSAAGDGETNDLTLSSADGGYVVVDPGANPLTVAGDCTLQPPVPPDPVSDSALCPSQDVTFIAIDLGDGVDVLTIGAIAYPPSSPGEPAIEALGGSGGDHLHGGPGPETIAGGDGVDEITGGAGSDVLQGNDGDDHVEGGAGADAELSGGAGDDELLGGEGDDELRGGDGDDRLAGGDGNDRFDYAVTQTLEDQTRGSDAMDGGPGDDILLGGETALIGGDGGDSLSGGPGADVLRAGRGNDRLDGGAGPDLLSGEAGTDTVTYEDRTNPVSVTFNGLPDDGERDEHDNVADDIEIVLGGREGDTLTGKAGGDTQDGGPGEDLIDGGPQADRLTGGDEPDLIRARDGSPDVVLCGGGGDLALVDRQDTVREGETVDAGGRRTLVRGETALVRPEPAGFELRLPGGTRFFDMRETVKVPLRSTIDATAGPVQLSTARTRAGARQRAFAEQGIFALRQTSGARPRTRLLLRGSFSRTCRGAAAARGPGRQHKRRRVRLQTGKPRGKWEVRGAYSSGAAEGPPG